MQKSLLEKLLFREDLCEPPYIVHQENYRKYRKLLVELFKLKGKGLCDFTYDKITQPFPLHCAYVTWTSQNDSIDINPSSLVLICDLVEGILIDQDFKTWQFSSKIYEEI